MLKMQCMEAILLLSVCLRSARSLTISSSAGRLLAIRPIDAIIHFPAFNLSLLENSPLLSLPLTLSDERRQLVYHALRLHCEYSQEGVKKLLESRDERVGYRQYWIDNTLHIKGMDRELLEELEKREDLVDTALTIDTQIASIVRGQDIANTHIVAADGADDEPDVGGHLRQMNIQRAWLSTNGSAEIVIATIDTGVQYDHPALVASYRGTRMAQRVLSSDLPLHNDNDDRQQRIGRVEHKYNWLEKRSETNSPEPHPHDPHGHGTHTMGSIVGAAGKLRLGVAPGLSWITARGCDGTGCLRSDLTEAAQWVLCPENECRLGAHVVSNSWGATNAEGMAWFDRVAAVWRAGGLVAVFAAGNSGPVCSTINSPATFADVLTVGAVNQHNRICSFSSRSADGGPAKPDVVAPGLNIVSSYPGSRFAEMSGTSMACPMVAGLAGLVLSANPLLSREQVMQAIRETADGTVVRSDRCCVDGKCAYGRGIVDAALAVARANQL